MTCPSLRANTMGRSITQGSKWTGNKAARSSKVYSRTLTHAGVAAEASLKRCETRSGHSSGVATPSPGRPTGAHHASEKQLGGQYASGHSAVAQNASGHRVVAQGSQAAAPHAGKLAAAQEQPEGAFCPEAAALAASGHAVDPIEKSAPAWGLDPTAPPTHPSPFTPAQPESAYRLDSSSDAQSACVTKSEPAASVLPWLDQSHAALLTDSPEQKPVTGHRHSLKSAIAAGPALQVRTPLRPATQPESAVDSSLKSSETVTSVRQVSTGSQAAGAGGEWLGFASVDEGQDDDSNADWSDDHLAQGTSQSKSSAYKVDAVAEGPRLSEQQGISGFDGFDVISGRPTPDLIGLPVHKAMKAKQPIGEPSGERRSSDEPSGERRSSGEPSGERRSSGEPSGERRSSGEPSGERRSSGEPSDERRSSGEPSDERRSSGEPNGERRSSGEPNGERRISGEPTTAVGSKGPSHDALGSRGYAASSRVAAFVRRSTEQQRAQPSVQLPVPSPKLSGIAHQQKAFCHSYLNLFCCWHSGCSQL